MSALGLTSFVFLGQDGTSLASDIQAMVSDEFSIFLPVHDAVFIDIAKVASSSLKATLAGLLELEGHTGNPHEVVFPRPPEQAGDGERLYPSRFTFAFVRNPWDRLVSCYRDKIRGEVRDFTGFAPSGVAYCLDRFDVFFANMPFDDFVRAVVSIPDAEADEHFRSQADFVTNSRGSVAVDFVGRFEKLDEDFSTVARRIGLGTRDPLPHLQAAPARGFAGFYTEETAAMVHERYRRDAELFGYELPRRDAGGVVG